MGNVGDIERIMQNRVVKLFKEKLGYTCLGNWEDRPNNSNIEEALLTNYLTKKGYGPAHITASSILAPVAKRWRKNLNE
jgi:type I restriction enzyme, R subunit